MRAAGVVRAWLVPAAVGVAVLAAVLGVEALTNGDAGTGPDPSPRLVEETPPPLPSAGPQEAELPSGMTRIVGYQADRRLLTVVYRVSDLSCTQLVVRPVVREEPGRIVLRLRRAAVADPQQLVNCPLEPYLDRVYVDLAAPLAGRAVVDGSSGSDVAELARS